MKLVVCLSASGTTLQNLLDRIQDHRLDAEIVKVISSSATVFGVERARRAGLPVEVVPKGSPRFSERVFDAVRDAVPDFVILAGWLQLLHIPDDFTNRVLNIHPSLLPSFGGKGMYGHHVHEAVIEYGAKISGCTVHFADNTYDTGPIILQKTVPVLDHDTAEALAARVYAAECEAYPEAIRRLASESWRVVGRRVVFGNDSV